MDYFVTGNLKHSGREYGRGEQIEFGAADKEATKQLLEAGVIQTEPLVEDNAEDVTPEPEQQPEPEVGGKPLETGEPSIDGEPERVEDNAEDVTPGARKGSRRALSPDVGPQDAAEPESDPSANL